MAREKLGKEAITAALADLDGWSLAKDGADLPVPARRGAGRQPPK